MKIGRYFFQILIAILVGGIIGGLFNSGFLHGFFSKLNFAQSQSFLMISCICVSIIVIVLTIYQYFVQKDALFLKRKSESGHDDTLDELLAKADLQYNKSDILFYSQITVVMVYMIILLVGGFEIRHILYFFIPFYLIGVPSLMSGFFYRKYDSRYPKLGEKDYTKKVLDIKDEGERHITLLSMYKIYQFNLVGLFLCITVVFLFSLSQGNNQSFSLLILTLLFIYNTFGYLFKVRRHYK